jgi:hypothetical protein
MNLADDPLVQWAKSELFPLSHPGMATKTYPRRNFPQCRLVPGFEACCLVMLGISYSQRDPSDLFAWFFPPDETPDWNLDGFESKIPEIDMSAALRRFKQSVIVDRPEFSDLLRLYDRSAHFPKTFCGIHTLDAMFSPVVLGTVDAEHFGAARNATISWPPCQTVYLFSGVRSSAIDISPYPALPSPRSLFKFRGVTLSPSDFRDQGPDRTITPFWIVGTLNGVMTLWLFQRERIIEIGDSYVSQFAASEFAADLASDSLGDVRIYFVSFGHCEFVPELEYCPSANALSRCFRATTDTFLLGFLREQRAPVSDVDYIKHCIMFPSFFLQECGVDETASFALAVMLSNPMKTTELFAETYWTTILEPTLKPTTEVQFEHACAWYAAFTCWASSLVQFLEAVVHAGNITGRLIWLMAVLPDHNEKLFKFTVRLVYALAVHFERTAKENSDEMKLSLACALGADYRSLFNEGERATADDRRWALEIKPCDHFQVPPDGLAQTNAVPPSELIERLSLVMESKSVLNIAELVGSVDILASKQLQVTAAQRAFMEGSAAPIICRL